MTTDEQHRRLCGFVPYPGNRAYGHWTCGKPRWHLGRHRFINYTIARIPHFWRLRFFWREIRCTRRLRRMDKPGYRTPYRFRRALYPATYRPLPVQLPGAVEPDPDAAAKDRSAPRIRAAVLAGMLALLSLIAWLLITEATSLSGRPSHGSTISSPTAAYPR